MKKRLLLISLIFSFVAMSCLVCSVALAQEADMPPVEGDMPEGEAPPMEGEAPPEDEGTPVDVPASPPKDKNGMVVEELMTDISEDMLEVLDAAAERAIKEEEKLDELKMDEMVDYEDLEVTGDVRILPDSFLYPFKNIGRGIDTFFTFDPVNKAEKELDYANKKIMESHQLVEEKGMSEDVAKAVEKAVISAEQDLEDISDIAEKLKEQRIEEAPKVEKFLDKVVNHTLKQQKVIEKLEEQLPEKNLAKVVEAKEKSLEHFGETMTKVTEKHEEITERITKAMDEQKGSDLKDLKNLEVLEMIKEKIPEEAREAIEHVQEDRTRVFQEKFKEMPKEVRAEKVDRYLGDMKGNALRQFDMLDDMKRSAWVDEDLIKELDMLKDKMVKKFETKFAGFTETVMKDQFMGHLMNGDPDDFRTLEQIEMRMGPMDMGPPPELEGRCFDPYDCEQYCVANPDLPGCEFMKMDFGPPPEIREAMKRVHGESVNKFRDRFAGDPEAMKNSEAIKKALANPDAIDFKLLDMVYESMPPEQRDFADKLRRDVEDKMIDMMKMGPMGPPPFMDFGPEGPPPGFMPPPPRFMMDQFVDPNPESMEMLARLRDRMPEEERFYMERAMDQQMNRMDEHMYKMDDQEMFDRMNYQMQEDVTVRYEIERRDENFFGDIDRRRYELEEQLRMLDEEKMHRMDDMKMEMMRGQREFMPMNMPSPMMMGPMDMGPPPEEMMRMFEDQQRMFQDKMKERGIDPCDFNNDGRVDEYESSQCKKGQMMAPPQDQGFFNKMKNIVPFRGDQDSQPSGPCDFNNDGYVDLYEEKQCAEQGPMMPPPEETRGFFDRMRDFVPFVPDSGTPCGSSGGMCGSGDYCANPSIGWCCPHGMTYDSSGAGGCVGEATPQSKDKGFFDRMRDFVPFMPDKEEGVQCGPNRCAPGEYCMDPAAGKCGWEPQPEGVQCGSAWCDIGDYCADWAASRCIPSGIPPSPPCDFNNDGYVDDAERRDCTVTIPPVEGWCGDGRCEPNEYCPQDCDTEPRHGCTGYMDSGMCTSQGCVWCPEEGGCFGPGYSCSHMTECNNNGTCDWNENMTSCPNDCRISDTGCQCSWGWSESCDCGGAMGCDYDNVCEMNETRESCPSDCAAHGPCGDGACDIGETPTSCPQDCGGGPGCQCSWGWSEFCDCSVTPTETCDHDGWCDPPYETMATCPADCGGITPPTAGCGSITSEAECLSRSDCGVFCTGESWPCYGPGHTCGTAMGCDNDGICDNDETMSSCPADCTTTEGCTCADGFWSDVCDCTGHETATACDNDGSCDPDESATSCPADCTVTTACNYDGYCDSNETMESCPDDCSTTTEGCGSYTDSSSCASQSDCIWCEGESSPYSCFGTGHVCSGGDMGYTCGDGVCDSGEICPSDCDGTTMSCNYDGYCDSDETMESCPDDCGGGWTECTTYGAVGDSCDPSVGSCCSPGMCSNMSGPGTCESSSDGAIGCTCGDGFWSDVCDCAGHEGGDTGGSVCGDGMCDSDETMDSCPGDCGTAVEPCTCPDGFWSDDCVCVGHDAPVETGCDCSCGWSDTCDCASMCPEPPPVTEPPPEGDMGECPPEGCMMMRGEYPNQSWLRRIFAFIFGF